MTDDSGKISAAEIANQFCPGEKIENIEKVVKCLDENEDGEIGTDFYIYLNFRKEVKIFKFESSIFIYKSKDFNELLVLVCRRNLREKVTLARLDALPVFVT